MKINDFFKLDDKGILDFVENLLFHNISPINRDSFYSKVYSLLTLDEEPVFSLESDFADNSGKFSIFMEDTMDSVLLFASVGHYNIRLEYWIENGKTSLRQMCFSHIPYIETIPNQRLGFKFFCAFILQNLFGYMNDGRGVIF